MPYKFIGKEYLTKLEVNKRYFLEHVYMGKKASTELKSLVVFKAKFVDIEKVSISMFMELPGYLMEDSLVGKMNLTY